MKRLSSIVLAIVIVLQVFVLSVSAYEAENEFGAKATISKDKFSLEEMMKYAIEDEYLARDEYLAIIKKFSINRPFSNIVKAEERHISLMEDLYKQKGMKIPEIKTEVYIPETLEEAYKMAVDAEIANIAMYEKFIAQELPEDVKEVFIKLMNASKYHLRAFERNQEDSSYNCRNESASQKSKREDECSKEKNCRKNFSGSKSVKNKGFKNRTKTCNINENTI